MDRFAVTVAFLFFLFSFTTYSYAYIIVDKTFIPSDPETTTNRARAARAILLPSEKPESEPVSKITESDDTVKLSSSEKSTEPETESISLSFRPINHHFRFQSPGRTIPPFRPHHHCRHHHQLLKRWDPRLRGREVSYGDDMLISDGNKGVGPDPMLRGGVRQIPDRWSRFQPEVNKFPYLEEPRRWDEPREDEKTKKEEEEENHEEEHHHDHHDHEKGSFTGVRKLPWYSGY